MDLQPIEKQYTIKDAVKNQKCPFRKRTETHLNNSITEEFMMPCDPYCLALIYHRDEKNPNKGKVYVRFIYFMAKI